MEANAAITFCLNESCKNKYKCRRFIDEDSVKYSNSFWKAYFKPNTCPERKSFEKVEQEN